jgi:spore maturation protein CgeB
VVAIDIASHPTRQQAADVIGLLRQYQCQLLFTVNEWGMDTEGIVHDHLVSNSIPHVNWCVDDPFYETIMLKNKFRPSSVRIDFVSDRDYLMAMHDAGYNARFLPLASDLSLYKPLETERTIECSFVGNSYLRQIDAFSRGNEVLLDTITPFLAGCLQHYHCDASFDIGREITDYCSTLGLPGSMNIERASFIAKHVTGYLFRKRIVGTLIEKVNGFTLFGDDGWSTLFPGREVGNVRYGEGLCSVYNSTKVNIDINRVVIRSGFTQRIFDTLASGAFVITSAKPVVNEFFKTEGADKEVVTFKSGEELVELIRYYTVHDTEREAIARRGREKVTARHTYDHRIAELFRAVAEELG